MDVYLEYTDPTKNSNKFWSARITEVRTHDPANPITYIVEVKWGRIGTAGQVQSRPFKTSWQAKDFINTKVVEKTNKGYRHVNTRRITGPSPSNLPGRIIELLKEVSRLVDQRGGTLVSYVHSIQNVPKGTDAYQVAAMTYDSDMEALATLTEWSKRTIRVSWMSDEEINQLTAWENKYVLPF